MRVKIFSCQHRPPKRSLNTQLFQVILSGATDAGDGTYIGDLNGINIADKNEFSEIRHHFYVWKNLLSDYDYVGFEHYRRMFFVNPIQHDRLSRTYPSFALISEMFDVDQKLHEVQQRSDEFYNYMTIRENFTDLEIEGFKRWLACHDVVVPRMWHLHDRPDLEHEWKNSGLPPAMWDFMITALAQQRAFSPMPDLPIRTSSHGNLFIMRSDLFNEYMEGLFAALDELRGLMKGKIDDFPRMWGYVCEKALNYFILAKRKERPFFTLAQMPLIISTLTHDLA